MATKKFDRTLWHGTDSNKAISLFEYGLLVRYVPKEKKWQCVYRNPYGFEELLFSYSWTTEEELREIFLTGWAKNDLSSFLAFVGCNWSDWLSLPIATKIITLFQYYGAEEIFESDYNRTYTTKEICHNLRIKYKEEYETMC